MKLIAFLTAALLLSLNTFASDWQDLFDGKSFNGWTEKTKENSFEIVDGTIVGTMVGGKGTTFLCYEKEYSDFELEFEINIINPEINSGVQFRSACKEPAGKQKYGAVYGPQIELATKKAQSRSGLIYGQGWKSWLTEKDVASHTHMKQQGWNKVRLVAIGKSVKTWINGQFIHETIIPDDRHATNSKGFIALQCHGIKDPGPYKIAWKNIRVKDLTKEK
ncbi:MAG: DUF1080 domain-containing protein [Lentisphaerales bacterium]|nr:DUF1080 domain-containing protein [Lentisphaerales bacterium]